MLGLRAAWAGEIFVISGKSWQSVRAVADELPPLSELVPAPILEGMTTGEGLFPELPAEALETKAGQALSFKLARSRAKGAALLILRQQGYTRKQIGQLLGMAPNAVRVALNRARAQGKLNELRGILENDSLALAVEGLNYHLEKRDKDAIFKHLEGMGHWKSYSNNKTDGGGATTLPPLTVNIQVAQLAPGVSGQPVVVSEPMGKPREDEP